MVKDIEEDDLQEDDMMRLAADHNTRLLNNNLMTQPKPIRIVSSDFQLIDG